jgi:hypothetical protein
MVLQPGRKVQIKRSPKKIICHAEEEAENQGLDVAVADVAEADVVAEDATGEEQGDRTGDTDVSSDVTARSRSRQT